MAISERSAPLLRYGFAVAAVLFALMLTTLLQPFLDRSVFVLFFGAVIVVAWYGGVRPALLTVGLSTIACQYFLIHPVGVLVIDPSEDLVRLLIFVLVSLLICAVIAARKRSEQALRASEAQVRCLVEANIAGFIHSHFAGHILDANDAFLKMVGYTRDDLRAGKVRWDQLTPPEHLHLSDQAMESLKSSGVCAPFEKEYIRKDGSRVPVLIGLALLEGTQDQAVCFVLDLSEQKRSEDALKQMRNQLEVRVREQTAELWRMNEELKDEIREHKQAEQALRLSERRFRYLAEHMDEVFWFAQVNPDRTLYVSPGFETIWGRSVNELYENSRLWLESIHSEDRARVQNAFESWLSGQAKTYDIEYRILRRRSEVRWIHDRGVKDEKDGRPVLVGGIATDITERKRAEEAISMMKSELAHASRVHTMGELVASIAHEINQPLAAVVTNANTCLRWLSGADPDHKELHDAVQDIVNDANRASDVIARTRELLKKSSLQTAQLDINEIIREVVTMVSGDVAMRAVSLRTVLASTLPRLLGDRIQLQQVLLNLILNAVEAMTTVPETARELVIQSSVQDSNKVFVQVRDTGVGLDPNTLDRIFDPFFTTKPNGMGMGLSISRSIIEAHGGKLRAMSNAPRGAKFYFRLPAG